MKDQLVLRIVAKILIPFILMFGLYIQLHGEYSPGGGFQAGVIFAAAFFLYCLIFGQEKAQKVIPVDVLKILSAFGALLYTGVGVATMFMGGNFLDYNVLAADPVTGQKIGILIIELGIGIAVFSVMLLIFFVFVERKDPIIQKKGAK